MNTDTRCGMVSIVGRPNVGKSTLLNAIVGEKVAIVTSVPQTTRQQIRGIYTDERGQIVFIDTPGLHKAADALDKYMNNASLAALQDADALIHLVDANKPVGVEEKMVLERLCGARAPVILALNKIDAGGTCADRYIELWRGVKGEAIHNTESFLIMPVSAKTGYNIDALITALFERLEAGPALYPVDTVSDAPLKLVVADIIREKLFELLRNEIPHAVAVVVTEMTPKRRKVTYIHASVLVERNSHKEIVIGKKGDILKTAGTAARNELERLLERTVFLELQVKLKKNWRDNQTLLKELGYCS